MGEVRGKGKERIVWEYRTRKGVQTLLLKGLQPPQEQAECTKVSETQSLNIAHAGGPLGDRNKGFFLESADEHTCLLKANKFSSHLTCFVIVTFKTKQRL